jgi:hypothetical protein
MSRCHKAVFFLQNAVVYVPLLVVTLPNFSFCGLSLWHSLYERVNDLQKLHGHSVTTPNYESQVRKLKQSVEKLENQLQSTDESNMVAFVSVTVGFVIFCVAACMLLFSPKRYETPKPFLFVGGGFVVFIVSVTLICFKTKLRDLKDDIEDLLVYSPTYIFVNTPSNSTTAAAWACHTATQISSKASALDEQSKSYEYTMYLSLFMAIYGTLWFLWLLWGGGGLASKKEEEEEEEEEALVNKNDRIMKLSL